MIYTISILDIPILSPIHTIRLHSACPHCNTTPVQSSLLSLSLSLSLFPSLSRGRAQKKQHSSGRRCCASTARKCRRRYDHLSRAHGEREGASTDYLYTYHPRKRERERRGEPRRVYNTANRHIAVSRASGKHRRAPRGDVWTERALTPCIRTHVERAARRRQRAVVCLQHSKENSTKGV